MTVDSPLDRYEGSEVEIRLTNDEHVIGVLDSYAGDFFVLTGDGDPGETTLGDAQRNYLDGERTFNVDHVVSVEPTD